jgi:hypothetical protein
MYGNIVGREQWVTLGNTGSVRRALHDYTAITLSLG